MHKENTIDLHEIVTNVENILGKNTHNSLKNVDRVAVAFSGGLDSSIIIKIIQKYSKAKIFPYTIGTVDSFDKKRSVKSAKALKILKNYKFIKLDKITLQEQINNYKALTNDTDKTSLSFSVPLYILMQNVNEDTIVTGHGADTIFGGFNKYLRSKDLKLDIHKNYLKFKKDIQWRENKIAKFYNKKLYMPFSDQILFNFVQKVPAKYIIYQTKRKYILMKLATKLGLDESIVNQNKKAFQYSSGTSNILKKL